MEKRKAPWQYANELRLNSDEYTSGYNRKARRMMVAKFSGGNKKHSARGKARRTVSRCFIRDVQISCGVESTLQLLNRTNGLRLVTGMQAVNFTRDLFRI